MADYSSSFTSCFRPTSPKSDLSPTSGNPNLTTCLYHTNLGLTSLTWCKNIFGRSLHIDLHFEEEEEEDEEAEEEKNTLSSSFRLHLKPLLFWRKHGVKRFDSKTTQKTIEIYWDLTKAKFYSNSEPQSGFYVCVVVNGEMILVVGDLMEEAYERTKTRKIKKPQPQSLVLRREHVFGNKVYTTKARFGGKIRDIFIDCSVLEEPKLSISVEGIKVLEIKRLKWKFRGSERIEVDGIVIQFSWDVFNWLFEDDGHAVFMFRFEETGVEEEVETELKQINGFFGMNGFEKKKLRRSSLRSSSSSSMSSGSSGSSCSIMEWASQEENELQSLSGFSLLVYAWKS